MGRQPWSKHSQPPRQLSGALLSMEGPYNVLVTGSSGHLGAALMLKLPSLGYSPLGIDILASPTTHHIGSVSDRSFISSILAAHPAITHIVHAATLHKPHIGSHTQQDFIDTNIKGTLVLLECAATLPILQSFVFISTTSTFGSVLSPAPGQPAIWIDESVTPSPKNIYGVTKCAAEDLCLLASRQKQTPLPVVILRTSRFFPEGDDDDDRRASMTDDNLKVLELAYRRCDIADIVTACDLAMQRARTLSGERFVISAPPPFTRDEVVLRALNDDSRSVFSQCTPEALDVFRAKGWRFLQRMDRVYDSRKAVEMLGWQPQYTFERAVQMVAQGREWRSELALQVGKKGYHAVSMGVYTAR